MKTIEVGIVEMYVNGVLHTLDLAGHHLEKNNRHSTQIEIENAKVELRALSQDLKSRRESQTQEVDVQKWEYMVIDTSSYGSWVDRANGEEIRDNNKQKYGLHAFLVRIGKEGWEVVASHSDSVLVARRPIVE